MNAGGEADRVLLDHIRECIERIQEYTGQERSVFFESHLVQDAVMRNLQTLAESTQRLSEASKDDEQDVPWRAIAGFATCWCTATLVVTWKSCGAWSKKICRSCLRRSNAWRDPYALQSDIPLPSPYYLSYRM